MTRGKLTVGLLLALGLVLTLGFASWANPFGMGGMGGMGGHPGFWGHGRHWQKCTNLTPEQAGKLFDLRQKFLDDTASLRKEMWVKRVELRALWRADNPDEKLIIAKLKEINAVRDKLQPKFVAFRLEVKKILPKAPGPKAKVSMDDEGPNPNSLLAMEPGEPADF